MKITDRALLGMVAGLGANALKTALSRTTIKMKIAELDGPEIAAGMFLPGHALATTKGQVVGFIADNLIAGILGTVTVYGLTLSGKNSYVLKGALMGQIMWQGLYGITGQMGASQVKPSGARTVLSELVTHTIFGAVAATIAANLGHEVLFNGEIPITAATIKLQTQQEQSQYKQAPPPAPGEKKTRRYSPINQAVLFPYS